MRHLKGHAMAFLLAYASMCMAQESDVVKRLGEQSEEYRRSIPNFTCSEIATSTIRKNEKTLRRIEFQGEVRVQRKDDKSLEEKLQITSYMGQPMRSGEKFDIPVYFSGGLSQGLPSFFRQKYQSCYDYKVSGNRIDFHIVPAKNSDCGEKVETTGFGLLDSQAQLLHGEIKRSPKEALRQKETSAARIDYADVKLDDRVFRMPTHIYAEAESDGSLGTFEAYYTACKLFTAKTTIRPGDGVDPQPQP